MKLHILYSGRAEGGAQKFALGLAQQKFATSTIAKGNFKSVLESRGLSVIDVEHLGNYKFEVIVLSDIRALLFYVKNSKILISKKVYFVPHTDKILQIHSLVSSICAFYKIDILPTTRSQSHQFRKKLWFTVGHIPDFVEQNLSTDGVIYFGRFEKVKRLQKLIDDFNASKSSRNGILTLQGVGDEAFERCGLYVQVNRIWLERDELDCLLSVNKFNINYSKTEGLSLSSLEAVGKGLTPLFYSQNCIKNYGLDRAHLVTGPADFADLQSRSFVSNEHIIEGLMRDSRGFEFLDG